MKINKPAWNWVAPCLCVRPTSPTASFARTPPSFPPWTHTLPHSLGGIPQAQSPKIQTRFSEPYSMTTLVIFPCYCKAKNGSSSPFTFILHKSVMVPLWSYDVSSARSSMITVRSKSGHQKMGDSRNVAVYSTKWFPVSKTISTPFCAVLNGLLISCPHYFLFGHLVILWWSLFLLGTRITKEVQSNSLTVLL